MRVGSRFYDMRQCSVIRRDAADINEIALDHHAADADMFLDMIDRHSVQIEPVAFTRSLRKAKPPPSQDETSRKLTGSKLLDFTVR